MNAYWLFVTCNGRTSVLTFADAFTRGLACIALSAHPVTLRLQDCG